MRYSPERQLTDQFRRDYPVLRPGATFLFTSDYFPPQSFDLVSNLRLMYHDPLIMAARLNAPADQQPDRSRPLEFDHVLTAAPGGYDLDAIGAHEFLVEKAWLLEQSGFGVLLPAWWSRKGTKLRLNMRANVRSPKMQGGGLSLDGTRRQ